MYNVEHSNESSNKYIKTTTVLTKMHVINIAATYF